jgi:MYXO-CTERM domain-containing protein
VAPTLCALNRTCVAPVPDTETDGGCSVAAGGADARATGWLAAVLALVVAAAIRTGASRRHRGARRS